MWACLRIDSEINHQPLTSLRSGYVKSVFVASYPNDGKRSPSGLICDKWTKRPYLLSEPKYSQGSFLCQKFFGFAFDQGHFLKFWKLLGAKNFPWTFIVEQNFFLNIWPTLKIFILHLTNFKNFYFAFCQLKKILFFIWPTLKILFLHCAN